MKMEQTECSETSEYKIRMPGNHPKESIQHSGQGESLKSRIKILLQFLEVSDQSFKKQRIKDISYCSRYSVLFNTKNLLMYVTWFFIVVVLKYLPKKIKEKFYIFYGRLLIFVLKGTHH